ncbi:MAG: hypothetical protein H7A23_16865 [Leptospiraceae bacterium]|nr:hypothetical protein [Leptospiraceae bacterium]
MLEQIIDMFWNKAVELMHRDNNLIPVIFGLKLSEPYSLEITNLVPEMQRYDWGNSDDRYSMYYSAFQKVKKNDLTGLVSISESWTTTIDVEGLKGLGYDPNTFKSSGEFIQLREIYPEMFNKTESIILYIDWEGSNRLVWGKVFRENENPDGKVAHVSEYVEFAEGQIDGLIQEAKINALNEA